MNFPRNIEEIGDFFKWLQGYPLEDRIRILEDAVEQTHRMSFMGFGRSREVSELLQKSLELLKEESRWHNGDSYRIIKLQDELQYMKERLKSALADNKELNFIISSGMKSYKNLCIFILSHPRNGSSAGAEILSRMNYLDKMTRDVSFIMPGYDRAKDDDAVVNESDANLQLTFDENVFIDMMHKLDDQSNGKFQYKDECEMVFVGVNSEGEFDFDNLQRLNLDLLSKKRGIDPVKLIIEVAQRFRTVKEKIVGIGEYVNQILGELTMIDETPTKKVFIAGAKRLKAERALFREELNKIENALNVDIRSLTFEDFATSLTGEDGGRQANYNKFIREDANAVAFIFDTTAGEITEEEFDVAYTSLKEDKHPDIFVYVRKRRFPFFMDSRLRNIKKKIFNYGAEYYVEYENLDDLRYKFSHDMKDYFNNKS